MIAADRPLVRTGRAHVIRTRELDPSRAKTEQLPTDWDPDASASAWIAEMREGRR